MNTIGRLIKRLIDLIYHQPFDHNYQEILWYFRYKLKDLFKYGTFDIFYKVELETITSCNRRCRYCPNFLHPKKRKLMDLGLFKKIIDDLVKMDYSGIISPHFYGEPLLDKRLVALMRYARKKLPKAFILVYTNGDHLTESVFLELVKNGVDKFFVTQHEDVPPKRFLGWYAAASSGDKDKIIFERMNSDSTLSNRGGSVKVKNKKSFKRCSMPGNNLVIDVDGDVLLCCNDFFGKNRFGNVGKKPLIDIWNGKQYKRIRDKIAKGKFSLEICKRCRD